MFPANRVNRIPEWKDYCEAARRMVAAGIEIEDSSLEECHQMLADTQADHDYDLVDAIPQEETPDAPLALSN